MAHHPNKTLFRWWRAASAFADKKFDWAFQH
jgi:hypothetical protein